MNQHRTLNVAASPSPVRDHSPAVSEAKLPANLIIADASKVTPRQFLDAIFGDSDETRAARRAEQQRTLIAIIKSGGSLRGWPPIQVAAARKIIADLASEVAL